MHLLLIYIFLKYELRSLILLFIKTQIISYIILAYAILILFDAIYNKLFYYVNCFLINIHKLVNT